MTLTPQSKKQQNPSPNDIYKAILKLNQKMPTKNIISLIEKLFWRQYNPNQIHDDPNPGTNDISPKQPLKKNNLAVKNQNLKIEYEDTDPVKNIHESMSIMRIFRASPDLRDIQRIVQLPRMHNGWDKNDPQQVIKNKGEYQRRFQLCTAVIKSFQANGFGSRPVRKFTTMKMDCYIYQTMLLMSSRVFFRMLQKYMMVYVDPKLKYTPHSQYALMSCLLFSKKDYFSEERFKKTFIMLLKLTFEIEQCPQIKKQDVIDLYHYLITKLKTRMEQVAIKNQQARILVKQQKIKLQKKHLLKFQDDQDKPKVQRSVQRKKKKKKATSTPAPVIKKQKIKVQQQPKKVKKIQKKKKKPQKKKEGAQGENNYYEDDYFDSDQEM